MDTFKEKLFNKYTRIDDIGHVVMSPMTICKAKKVLFYHIGKTAGSSTDRLLNDNGLNDNIINNMRIPYGERVKYFEEVVENWDEYFKFTTVRNKFDQLISLYEMDRGLNGKFSLASATTFEEFIKNHVARQTRPIDASLYSWPMDQYFLTHTDGKLVFDLIIKFDDYEAGLKAACERMNISYTPIKVNVGNYDKTKVDTYYTPELKELVRTTFAQEFEYFKWS